MLADVPGFDEDLGPGAKFSAAEDNDLSWRGLLHGWWTFQTSRVSVVHDGHRTLDELVDLISRDFYGIGGTLAKYVRSGHRQILGLLTAWLLRFGISEPMGEVLEGRGSRVSDAR